MTSPAANYPKDLPLRDALTVSIRPLAAGDEDALLAFFGDIGRLTALFGQGCN